MVTLKNENGLSIFLLAALLCVNIAGSAQENEPRKDSIYSLIYFGAASCYYCNVEKNIANINKMAIQIKKANSDLKLKLILVGMDKGITEGWNYVGKYELSNWDEVSVGSFYENELALSYLNSSEIPGVPHVMIIKHNTVTGKYNIKNTERQSIRIDLVGGDQIDKWINGSFSFEK